MASDKVFTFGDDNFDTEVLQAGLPVLVDKPLAASEHEAADLVRLANELGGRLTVFQNRRWDGEQLTLRARAATRPVSLLELRARPSH